LTIWDVTVFTKNRDRLLEGDVAARFMAAVLNQERVKALLSVVSRTWWKWEGGVISG
jgi:hypothetical protein